MGTNLALSLGLPRRYGPVLILVACFPAFLFSWSAPLVVFRVFVNEILLHRDSGIDGSLRAPLINGYYAVRGEGASTHGWVSPPVSEIVRKLQVSDPYILAAVESKHVEHSAAPQFRDFIDSYFILDTRSRQQSNFATYSDFEQRVRELGIELRLELFETIHSRYYFSWFDVGFRILWSFPFAVCALVFLISIRTLQTPQ